jgi:hypothetical protein
VYSGIFETAARRGSSMPIAYATARAHGTGRSLKE